MKMRFFGKTSLSEIFTSLFHLICHLNLLNKALNLKLLLKILVKKTTTPNIKPGLLNMFMFVVKKDQKYWTLDSNLFFACLAGK